MAQDQRNQKTEGTQINTGDHTHIDHIGDKFDTGGGDVIQGNQTVIINEAPAAAPNPLLTFKPFLFEPKTILIPSGTFTMGHEEVRFATPSHEISLPAFRIGVYPVTNREYAYFILKTGRVVRKEQLWQGNRPSDEQLDHPVSGVSWYDAMAYCEWLHEETKRPYTLPSEAQWERAARGIDGRFYPWGNDWQESHCTVTDERTAVDAHPPQTETGLYDMVGNVREWTMTLWGSQAAKPYPSYAYPWQADGRNDPHARGMVRRVVRGGRGTEPAAFGCCARGSYLPDKVGRRRDRLGFRIVIPIGDDV